MQKAHDRKPPTDRAHQVMAGMMPRPGRGGSAKVQALAASLPPSDESLEDATLRLQRARADTEELDKAKRQWDLDVARGKYITKEAATDLAQAAVMRVCQILDIIPERLRDRLPPAQHGVCDALAEVIYQARQEVSRAD